MSSHQGMPKHCIYQYSATVTLTGPVSGPLRYFKIFHRSIVVNVNVIAVIVRSSTLS